MHHKARSNAAPGKTNGASVESGLSSYEQIKDKPQDLGEGQGQGDRPKGYTKSAGNGFKFKG